MFAVSFGSQLLHRLPIHHFIALHTRNDGTSVDRVRRQAAETLSSPANRLIFGVSNAAKLRVSEEEELAGLDLTFWGVPNESEEVLTGVAVNGDGAADVSGPSPIGTTG